MMTKILKKCAILIPDSPGFIQSLLCIPHAQQADPLFATQNCLFLSYKEPNNFHGQSIVWQRIQVQQNRFIIYTLLFTGFSNIYRGIQKGFTCISEVIPPFGI